MRGAWCVFSVIGMCTTNSYIARIPFFFLLLAWVCSLSAVHLAVSVIVLHLLVVAALVIVLRIVMLDMMTYFSCSAVVVVLILLLK